MTNKTQGQEFKVNTENPKCSSIVCNAEKFFKVIISLIAAENIPLYLLSVNYWATNTSALEILTGDNLTQRQIFQKVIFFYVIFLLEIQDKMDQRGLAEMIQRMMYFKTGTFKLLQKSILFSIFSV